MPTRIISSFAGARVGSPFAIVVCALATCLIAAVLLPAQQQETVKKRTKKHGLYWNPPDVNTPVRSAKPYPPCVIANVLEQAGTRAGELAADLQSFTAQEEIS